jgi:hypothetical protein
MSTIQLHQTTTLTPEQYIGGLTDFGPGRSVYSVLPHLLASHPIQFERRSS